MTLGEFRALTENLDDEAEILVSSSYDDSVSPKTMDVSDLETFDIYEDGLEGDNLAVRLLIND